MNYQPRTYWEERLAGHDGLQATGHLEHGRHYNWWLYQAKVKALRHALRLARVNVSGRSILDAGAGTGYFLSLYRRWGAARLGAVDISPTSVRRLKEMFPSATVWEADIAKGIPTNDEFDIVHAFDVIYHLQDPDFRAALPHLVRRCRPGGVLLLTDSFRVSMQPAAHVTFRTLSQYQEILFRYGGDVVGMIPVYRFLNRRGWLGNELVSRRLLGVATDLFAPLLYLADAVTMNLQNANLSLLVCRVRHSR
ncbi:MAG: class I SAM-dependent methyltransferase [bacterium]